MDRSYGYWAAQAASYAAGVLCALWLHGALLAPIVWVKPIKRVPVRVALKVATAKPTVLAPVPSAVPASKPAVAAPVRETRIKTNTTPERTVVKKQLPVPPVTDAPPAVTQAPASTELPTLAQPAIVPVATVVESLPPLLPPVPSGALPPLPPEVELQTYVEEPGGSVLVLELTVDDRGMVVDTRILVPSSNALSDLTLALATQGQYWKNIEPPLLPGERRRLELRVPYTDGQPLFNLP